MLTDLQDVKSRAKYISNYFEIRDGESRQLLISTHTNNPESLTLNDVIDNYVNDSTFKVLEVRIGNNPGDSKKVTYYLQAAGYEGEASNLLSLLQHSTPNGITINGLGGFNGNQKNNASSVEELIENKIAELKAEQAQEKLKDQFLFLSKELEIKQDFMEREFKLKQQHELQQRKILEAELQKEREAIAREREERQVFKEIGKGALEGLAGLAQTLLLGKSLNGLGNAEGEGEPKKVEAKKSPVSFKIVNQNGSSENKETAKSEPQKEEKQDEFLTALAGMPEAKKKLILKVIQESSDDDFTEDLENFLNSEEEEVIENLEAEEVSENGQG